MPLRDATPDSTLCFSYFIHCKHLFINRDLVTSFSSSVNDFTENRSPYHAWGNCIISYPRIFKATVKKLMICRCKRHRTLAWDSSCSFRLKVTTVFPLTLSSVVLDQPLTFQSNWPWIRVPHLQLPLRASKLLTISLLADKTLLTRWQTDIQTDELILFRKNLLSVEGKNHTSYYWFIHIGEKETK